MNDGKYMLRAVGLAEKGRGKAGTNPLVGSLVVRQGKTVGFGWYGGFGGEHAEARALAQAGRSARGATLYVTMEPCNSTGKTPPCTRMIAAAGIRRVVIGVADPSQRGNGIRELKRRGIRVGIGTESSRILEQNADFFRHRKLKRPIVTLKLALTLDGRIADRFGGSKWISSAEARKWTRKLRGRADAVMIGANTASTDDPGLLAPQADRAPLRIIVDPRARSGPNLKMIRRGRVLVAAGNNAPARRVMNLQFAGAEVIRVPAGRGGIDLRALLRTLYSEGVASVLCEGGGRLAGSLLDCGLIDRMVLVIAPRIIGDVRAIPGFSGKARILRDAVPVRITGEYMIGGNVVLEAEPCGKGK